jgi:hypothetical protein
VVIFFFFIFLWPQESYYENMSEGFQLLGICDYNSFKDMKMPGTLRWPPVSILKLIYKCLENAVEARP